MKIYKNTPDDKSWLAMCFMMSKKESDDKGVNVKRGLKAKAENGQLPGSHMKPGYMWDKFAERGNKTILTDPDRYSIMKMAWEHMITGTYTVAQILDKINNEWGYKSVQRKQSGGQPMWRSKLYEVFTDPFYYGEYEYPKGSGNWYNGKYQRMITKQEFDRVQILLGRHGRPRPKAHDFPFVGFMICGECHAQITAEEKWQIICSACKYKFTSTHKMCPKCTKDIEEMENPKLLHYTYYHCTKRKNPNCTQRSIDINEIERQIDDTLEKIEVSPRFTKWAIKYLNELNEDEINDRSDILETIQKQYKECLKRLDNLTQIFISLENEDRSLLSDTDYKEQKTKLIVKKGGLEEQMKKLGTRVNDWLELTEEAFNFACYARYWFEHGDIETKRKIFSALGSNIELKNKSVLVTLQKPLQFISDTKIEIDKITRRFEPANNTDIAIQTELLQTENPFLLRD